LEGLGALNAGEAPIELLEAAATGFGELGAGGLEAVGRGALAVALAQARDPQAEEAAHAAARLGRRAGVPAAEALAHLALAELDPASDHRAVARTLQNECGLLGLLGP